MSQLANKNLLTIINSIRQAVIGENAADDGVRPTKAMLIEMVNNKQREIAGLHEDWTWLNAKESVPNYDVTGGGSTVANITPTSLGTVGVGQPNVAGTAYIASAYAPTTPVKVYSAVIPVGKILTGFGEFYGLMRALICPNVNGSPDILNPSAASDYFNPYRPTDTALIDEPFTFSTTPIIDAGDYFVVLEIAHSIYNGVPIVPGTIAGTSGGKYRENLSTTWTTGPTMAYSITGIVSTYLTDTLVIPNTWEVINCMKSNKGLVMYPMVNPHNGTFPPLGFFWVDSVNADGTITLLMNSNDSTAFTWTIDGKKRVLDMVDDTDKPQIPGDYRFLLEIGTQLDCVDLSINTNINVSTLEKRYNKGIEDFEFTYRDEQDDITLGTTVRVPNFIDNSINAEPDYKTPNIRR